MNKKPTALVILDGFGWREDVAYNAVAQAKKPTFDYLWNTYPHTLLQASGSAVGLPEGASGNSEVGHFTLGAGQIIQQPITYINNAIVDKSFFKNEILQSSFAQLTKNHKTLHIIALVSDGNVHGSLDHLYAYIKMAVQAGVSHIIIHAILDGRDVAPRSAAQYLQALQDFIAPFKNVQIGTLIGRFYAMDRDENWDRTAATYEALTTQDGVQFDSWQKALDYFYAHGIFDEFIPPTQLLNDATIHTQDGVLLTSIRPDRARQLISAFLDTQFEHFATSPLHLSFFLTPVSLEDKGLATVIFPLPNGEQNLKKILSEQGKKIFSIAETEKYAHVTYFFAGNHAEPYKNEQQVLVPSLKFKDYREHPEMSAARITQKVLHSLEKNPADFYLINYANADMVGHSGDLQATIAAVECLDVQIKKLYDALVVKMGGTLFITADHGNAEIKYDEKAKQPHTAHTTSPVPFLYIDEKVKNAQLSLPLKGLSDVAPFILKQIGLETSGMAHRSNK